MKNIDWERHLHLFKHMLSTRLKLFAYMMSLIWIGLKAFPCIFLNGEHILRCAMNFHYCLFDVKDLNVRCANANKMEVDPGKKSSQGAT